MINDMKTKTILYVHGMGGNGHDGFYWRLAECLDNRLLTSDTESFQARVVTFDYDFDPEKAQEQIAGAISLHHPDLLVATSLGAFHTLVFPNIPRVLVSPALNAGKVIARIGEELKKNPIKRFMLEISLGSCEGSQALTANPRVLKKFQALAVKIDQNVENLKNCPAYAVYGGNDMYMQMNVVNPKHFEAIFNSADYDILPSYDHNFNGFDVIGHIIPKIYELLGINRD